MPTSTVYLYSSQRVYTYDVVGRLLSLKIYIQREGCLIRLVGFLFSWRILGWRLAFIYFGATNKKQFYDESPFPILYLVGYKRLDAIWIVRSTMGLRRRSGTRRTHSRTSLETSTSPPPLFQFFFSSVLFIRDKKIYNNHKNKILTTIKLYGRKGLSYWSDGRYFYI